jgi:transcriptional regulator with XRE-family HTH domain
MGLARDVERCKVTCVTTPKYPTHSRMESLRKRHGWKRSVLAKNAGLSYQHIYNVERGYMCVSDEVLQVIATALGVDVEEIQADDPTDPATEAGGSAEEVTAA